MLQTFEVENVRCEGCAATITKALEDAGFTEVTVDLSCTPRKVSADIADDASLENFKNILRKHGYPFVGENLGFVDATGMKAKSFVSCAVGKFELKK